jgi:hypothetical protein
MSTPIIDFSHSTPDEQLVELRRRRAALDVDGDPGEPWEAVLDQIGSRDR